MTTATITVAFTTTQRASSSASRQVVTNVSGLNTQKALGIRRTLVTFARDTFEVLQGIAAYAFVFMLMYWMGAFLYAAM